MTDNLVTKPCQCEHVSHFDKDERSPNGNPTHKYGHQFAEWFITTVHTPTCGTFQVCKDCADDCYHPENLPR